MYIHNPHLKFLECGRKFSIFLSGWQKIIHLCIRDPDIFSEFVVGLKNSKTNKKSFFPPDSIYPREQIPKETIFLPP